MNNNQEAQFLAKWSNKWNTESSEVEKEYDTLAQVYEEKVLNWQYAGHQVAAELIAKFVATDGKILDLGCGTGLAGQALLEQGYQTIIGVDISGKSLDLAREKNIYTALYKADIQQALPFQDNEFDGIISTAVLTNMETSNVLYEFCRVVKPGGYLVFTNREDIHSQKKFDVTLQQMESEGILKQAYLSPPQPYLPNNHDYAEKIKILYCAYEVCI
ncbi:MULTISPECIES: class I SAM-dependent methyltransferase [unclassified Moorena]|uniref:class I SAM-dependent DNA methyltransferase n=1 Tax=unclassified Moorena TaxID=2683338 RepID=UPI0013B5DD97|nr:MULTISPECIES: class I SAM-dependent methyltransferase [unclassified Moorena]NEQ12225.1 class I SAM-dependent methyltransferase [Moorena sp. SIO4E2]NEQ18092.1 class I SAM-dependent methyltransferase [Moorena sp. SIO3E2]NES41958.1 class I SAM-dependent methyltransferase [Moorena sp. SIO2C4]NES81743.1 class I SAM-dependent methyltransferase [Moorena sp. SIO2B7]